MAASLGDERAGRVDPGPGDGALVDRLLDAEGGAAEVADRREPAHERVPGADHGLGEHVAKLAHAGDHGRDGGERGVPVGIDEARDQRLAGSVDPAATGVARDGGGGRADGDDRGIADGHVERAVDPARDAIEDVDVRDAERLTHSCIPQICGPQDKTSRTARAVVTHVSWPITRNLHAKFSAPVRHCRCQCPSLARLPLKPCSATRTKFSPARWCSLPEARPRPAPTPSS